jgi:acyl-CoA synthetase (AMP-forming)/AMP-acid ligase II
MRIIDMLDRGIRLFPENAALIEAGMTTSYRELGKLSHGVANGLVDLGVEPGSHVAVLSQNSSMAYASIMGILRAACVWVPINSRSGVEENIFILTRNDVSALFYHSLFEAELDLIRKACPQIKSYICIDKPVGATAANGVGAEDDRSPIPQTHSMSDVVAIFPSGGTTGVPKGVQLTHQNFMVMAACFESTMNYVEPPVFLLAAPMTHAAGACTFPLLARGATIVVIQKPDPEEVLRSIQTYKVTTTYLPPTAIYILLASPKLKEYDCSSLRYLIYGAAPISADKLREGIAAFGPVFLQTYGQVEAPMFCTCFSPQQHVEALENAPHRLASCGKETSFARVEMMDDDGNIVANGNRGEVVVRSELVLKGYYKNDEATRESRAHGWHHTGDIGVRDDDGYIYIVDRKKDMIITGGFNVYPSEVERVLWAIPEVQDCAVIGVPDDKWGEAVKAVVELKPGHNATEEYLMKYCRARLGGVKAPKSVEIWESLPRSPVGKVLKKSIREKFWRGISRAI